MYDWFHKTKSQFNDSEFLKIYIDFPREELSKKNYRKEQLKCLKKVQLKKLKDLIN